MRKRVVIPVVLAAIVAVVVGIAVKPKSQTVTPVHHNAGSYVALGDSVAAGLGLEPPSDSSACERSNEAYTRLVAANLNFDLKSFACSGATIPVGVSGAQTVNDLALSSQLDRLYALSTTPKLITLTIGANDLGWTQIIGQCLLSTCGSATDTALVNARLKVLATNLSATMTSLNQHYSNNPPRAVVTGYYQVLPLAAATCSDLAGIDANELTWWRAQEDSLNKTIHDSVAGYTFTKFAAADFTGHELCSADPWVQDFQSSAAFHPTDAGQAAIARSVEASAAF